MYNPDTNAVQSGNEFTLSIVTPVPEDEIQEFINQGNANQETNEDSLGTYNPETTAVRSGNEFTLSLVTPIPGDKEPGDYEGLINKPRINGVVLFGNMEWEDFGIPDLNQLPLDLTKIPFYPLTDDEIDDLTDS